MAPPPASHPSPYPGSKRPSAPRRAPHLERHPLEAARRRPLVRPSRPLPLPPDLLPPLPPVAPPGRYGPNLSHFIPGPAGAWRLRPAASPPRTRLHRCPQGSALGDRHPPRSARQLAGTALLILRLALRRLPHPVQQDIRILSF